MPRKEAQFWQLVGPGAILVGLSIGAGEIVVWPRIAAQYGATMVWAAVVGVFIQLWVNLEVGRWTIVTGESVFAGFSRIWRGFAPVFVAFTVFGWIAPGWARVSGSALKALLVGPKGFGSDAFWTAVTFAFVALLLFGPKLAYHSVERTVELLVALVVVGLVTVAVAVGGREQWAELGRGVLNFGYREPAMSVRELFVAMVFAGAGGTANLFYTFYLRDKHIGMGARMPSMHNPLRGRVEKVPTTGYIYDDTDPENALRFRAWFRHVCADVTVFFWFLNTVTILLFIFGALCVLHPLGRTLNEGTLIYDEAEVLASVWGPVGRALFLIVGVATLFSTQLTLVDGCARSIADIVYFNIPAAQKRDVSWWYLLVAGAWIVVGTGLTWMLENYVKDLGFLFNAALVGGFAMAVYVPLLLYMNRHLLPRSARPGAVSSLFMVVATLVYVGFAAASLLWQFAPRPSGG
jgi:Mn2+/Fe2+ NRAMP family transporter